MVAVVQPAGLVTLVFTDIEGSTRLLRELGEGGYRQALAEHRDCVRSAFGRYRGYEVDCEGDAFFYAFGSAADAVQAVTEALAGLEDGPVRIRVGVHSGEPVLDPPRYVGLDVHKAARVMAAGHGGQVLLSRETQELLAERFPFRYLGEYRLKGLAVPERLYQLGLGEFPPLQTLYHTNLPVPATAFLGREQELSEVVDLLRGTTRLLTLTGPGGAGKTRLALEAAAAVSVEFHDGVWWVPLASLRDPTLLPAEVARVLGLDQPGRGAAELLAEVLAGKRLLLLLDNAEHLLPHAAADIARLRDIDGPKLLVTSRERLQLAGEHLYQVPPLAEGDGVALFTARARAVSAGLEAGPEVEELCARLDNLPLALELAAARTSVLSPAQILERLSGRLDLLKGGRDSDPRQQTLRSTIAWSHELLSSEEQRLFARLAVFTGGCTLDAAEQICDADLDTLAALVDKSLLRRSGVRYWMLETIREYANARLNDSEDAEALRYRHASFYGRFAAEAEQGMRGTSVGAWLDWVEYDLPNLRAAIEFSLDRSEPAAALRMSSALWRFWAGRSLSEGRTWLERALATGAGTAAERGEGCLGAGALTYFQGDHERAVSLLQDAIELARQAGVAYTRARALGLCSVVLAEQSKHQEALAMARGCRELASTIADSWARAEAQLGVPAALSLTGNHEEADALYQELLAGMREVGDEQSVAVILNAAGYAAILRGAYDEARPALEESLGIGRGLRDAFRVAVALHNLGLIALCQGRYDDALSLYDDALELCSTRGDRRLGSGAILGLAGAHAALGNLELAAKLDAIATAVRATTGIVEPAAVRDRLEPYLCAAREKTDPAIVVALTKQGPLTMDTAIAELKGTTMTAIPANLVSG